MRSWHTSEKMRYIIFRCIYYNIRFTLDSLNQKNPKRPKELKTYESEWITTSFELWSVTSESHFSFNNSHWLSLSVTATSAHISSNNLEHIFCFINRAHSDYLSPSQRLIALSRNLGSAAVAFGNFKGIQCH